MALSLNPNAGLSISLRNRFAQSVDRQQQSLERLGTGKRINRASDDPAGFIAAEQLRGELTEIQAELRTYDFRRLSLRESGARLATLQTELTEIRGQVVEATGDQIGDDERAALQQQVDAALETFAFLESGFDPSVVSGISSGGPANLVDGDTAVAAELVDAEASSVATEQARVGAGLRQLEVFEQIARDREVIVTETLSLIEDTDFAEETANLATAQVQTQAAAAALQYSQQTYADLIGSLLDRVDVAAGESEDG